MFHVDIRGLLYQVAQDQLGSDRIISRLKSTAAKQGKPVRCDGCREAGCCYQPVAVFIAEALYMASRNPVPVERREEFIRLGEDMENTSKDTFFHAAKPCVYLNADKTCAIYQNRPGACRRYYVVNEPQLCMPTSYKKVSALNTVELDNMWVSTMVQYQVTHLASPIVPIMMGALPKMMAIASTALELKSGREVRRYLRDQKWLDFEQEMAQMDPETLAAYKLSK